MKQKIKYISVGLIAFTPVISFAALEGVKTLLLDIKSIVGLVEPIIIGLAFLFFFWGMAQFILKAGDAKAREEGKQKMIWSVVALFVIISIMGIIHFVGDTIGIQPSGATNGSDNNTGDCGIFCD